MFFPTHWLRLFVDRELQNNQLKDLPQDIFRNNTQLLRLWVYLLIQIYKTLPLSYLNKTGDQTVESKTASSHRNRI